MASIEWSPLERRARWAYERGRLRLAALGVAPIVLLVAAAAWVARRPTSTLAFGAATALLVGVMLWYGREP